MGRPPWAAGSGRIPEPGNNRQGPHRGLRSLGLFQWPDGRKRPPSQWKQVRICCDGSGPDVVVTAIGPAIAHAGDNLPVTGANPARAGEALVLYARGLGPVRAAIDIVQPFPTSPLAAVNSPVEVSVNGAAAKVVSAEGYPGTEDGYVVTFTVPQDVAPGMASVQLTAGWIQGSVVRIAVQ